MVSARQQRNGARHRFLRTSGRYHVSTWDRAVSAIGSISSIIIVSARGFGRLVAQLAEPHQQGRPNFESAVSLAVIAMAVLRPERTWKTGGCQPSAREPEPRMDLHKNAHRTPHGPLMMIRRVLEQ
jgi:hypothetical protein